MSINFNETIHEIEESPPLYDPEYLDNRRAAERAARAKRAAHREELKKMPRKLAIQAGIAVAAITGMAGGIYAVARLNDNTPTCRTDGDPVPYYGATALEIASEVPGVRQNNLDLRMIPLRQTPKGPETVAKNIHIVNGVLFGPDSCK